MLLTGKVSLQQPKDLIPDVRLAVGESNGLHVTGRQDMWKIDGDVLALKS